MFGHNKHGNHHHGHHGNKAKSGSATQSNDSAVNSQPLTFIAQTLTPRENFDKKHPALATLGQKINSGLKKAGDDIREAHERRVARDEEIREDVRHKNDFPPFPVGPSQAKPATSSHNSDAEARQKACSKHMKAAQMNFAFGQYTLARVEYELAFRTKLEGRSVKNDLLWALVGVNNLLMNMENATIYLSIAECHIRLKEYESALNYLRQLNFLGTPILDIKSRIKNCEESLNAQRYPVPQPRTIVVVNQTSTWDIHRNEFIATAKKLLATHFPEDPNNQGWLDTLRSTISTAATDYQSLLAEVKDCIKIYDVNRTAPRQEEQTLRASLAVMQNKLQKIVETQQKEEQRPLHTKMAKAAEPNVTRLLHEAQELLAAGKLEEALARLVSARNLSKDNHPEYMSNQAFAQLDIFTTSVNKLEAAIRNFNQQRNTEPKRFAEHIVKEALPVKSLHERKRLFSVHLERIIGEISLAIHKNWLQYRGKKLEDLQHNIFKLMSDLIRNDLRAIDINKWFWRGGFSDELKLDHSHTIGPVLAAMIQHIDLGQSEILIDLLVFEQTNTKIAVEPIPVANIVLYDWQATLVQWPTMVQHPVGMYGTFAPVTPSAPPLNQEYAQDDTNDYAEGVKHTLKV